MCAPWVFQILEVFENRNDVILINVTHPLLSMKVIKHITVESKISTTNQIIALPQIAQSAR